MSTLLLHGTSQVVLVVKNLPANKGDASSIPRWIRSSGEEDGNPLQYSCLENSMDRGAWWATVHGVAKSQTWLSDGACVVAYWTRWVSCFFKASQVNEVSHIDKVKVQRGEEKCPASHSESRWRQDLNPSLPDSEAWTLAFSLPNKIDEFSVRQRVQAFQRPTRAFSRSLAGSAV